MNIVGAYLGCGFFLSEAALAIWRRSANSSGDRKRDAHSLRGLWIVNTLSITIGVWLAMRRVGSPLPAGWAVGWVGGSMFAVGTLLRWWSIYWLGRFFTVDVAIAKDHLVVDNGPYRLIRHPSYSGLLLQFCGLGFTFGTWASLAAVSIPPILTLMHRIRLEETALCEGLGPAYLHYMDRTMRLIPWLY